LEGGAAWPCTNIKEFKDRIKPYVADAGIIPDALLNALEFDFGTYKTPLERSEHFSFYIGRSQVNAMSDFWKSTLHRLLSTYANCPRPRTRDGLVQLILDNLFDLHGFDDDQRSQDEHTDNRETVSSISDEPERKDRSTLDLNNNIRVMTSIFAPSDRLTGEEHEPFMHRKVRPTTPHGHISPRCPS